MYLIIFRFSFHFSAADLYVKEYLHTHVQDGLEEMRPLRIYYQKRWINTVHPIVFEYCLVSNRGTPLVQFRRPTKEDILNHRVIVCTLSIARYLFDIGLDDGMYSKNHELIYSLYTTYFVAICLCILCRIPYS